MPSAPAAARRPRWKVAPHPPNPGLTFLSADQQAARRQVTIMSCANRVCGVHGGRGGEEESQGDGEAATLGLPLLPTPTQVSPASSWAPPGEQRPDREPGSPGQTGRLPRPQSHRLPGPWHWGGGGNLPTARSSPQSRVGPGAWAAAGFSAAKSGRGAGRVRGAGNGRDRRTPPRPTQVPPTHFHQAPWQKASTPTSRRNHPQTGPQI